MNASPTCGHCGAPLSPSERFCTACGQPAVAARRSSAALVLAIGAVLAAFVLGVVLVVAWARLRPTGPTVTTAATATAATAPAPGTSHSEAKAAKGTEPMVDDNVVFVLPDSEAAKAAATKAAATSQPAEAKKPDYVLADSATRRLKPEQIAALTPEQRRLARNEIYARHGYQFSSADLRRYFAGRPWYKPNPSFDEAALSATEKANANLIRQMEGR